MTTFGFTLTAKFVDLSEDMFRWRVALHKGERSYETDYRMGFAHCKKAPRIKPAHAVQTNTVKLARVFKPDGKLTIHDMEQWVVPTPPTLDEVLYSLQCDMSAGEHELFEDFAGEYGYDKDSRAAEKVWHACRDIRGHMRKLLGTDFDAFMSHDFDK